MEQITELGRTFRWLSSTVTTNIGSIAQVRQLIPTFERRAFGPRLLPVEGDESPFTIDGESSVPGYNNVYDVIVRQPLDPCDYQVPVGIVSKQYTLVQHSDIFDAAITAISEAGIKPEEVAAELDLSGYGERMRLGFLMPKRYNLKINGNDEMGLRLECFNSVDGSMKFMAVIGWLRFVCANGMIIGVADTYYKSRHTRFMQPNDIPRVLKSGIEAATREARIYERWQKLEVSDVTLQSWVNCTVAKTWGVKAAVRALHIVRTGRDCELADPFQKGAPTQKVVVPGKFVPGSLFPVPTVYAVSQALSWLAKERRDVQEQLEWKQQIPGLMKPLLKNSRA